MIHNDNEPLPPIKVILQINPSIFPVPAVILTPSGGMGDQLYRYAFSYSTSKNLNATLYLTVSNNDLAANRKFLPNQRLFTLDLFSIPKNVKFLKEELIQAIPVAKRLHLNEVGPWRKAELPNNKVIIVEDYLQAEMYWIDYKEEIKKQLSFKPEVLKLILGKADNSIARILHRSILSSESVAVHIRRGDFIGGGQNSRLISISYQIKAMKLLTNTLLRDQNITFFIFSDDIAYAKSVLEVKFNTHQLFFMPSGSSSLLDFYLMRICKHLIITNSGFSWWAAYLSNYKDKFIIAPFPRHRLRFYDYFGKKSILRKHIWLFWNKSYPEEWLTLNPFESVGESY